MEIHSEIEMSEELKYSICSGLDGLAEQVIISHQYNDDEETVIDGRVAWCRAMFHIDGKSAYSLCTIGITLITCPNSHEVSPLIIDSIKDDIRSTIYQLIDEECVFSKFDNGNYVTNGSLN